MKVLEGKKNKPHYGNKDCLVTDEITRPKAVGVETTDRSDSPQYEEEYRNGFAEEHSE